MLQQGVIGHVLRLLRPRQLHETLISSYEIVQKRKIITKFDKPVSLKKSLQHEFISPKNRVCSGIFETSKR